MTAIQIQGITAEDLLACIRDEIASVYISPSVVPSTALEDLKSTVIDRPFIERNLRVDYKRILRYEDNGTLRRIPHPEGRGGIFYLMSDYLKVYEVELARLKKKRR